MSPSPDIDALLRQKQLMDQITNQGVGAAMLGGGANLGQFNMGGGGQGADYTGLPAPRSGGAGAISDISGMLASKPPQDPTVHSMDYQAAQGPGGPQLVRAPGSSQLAMGPNGQLTMNQVPQFSAAKYIPTLGQQMFPSTQETTDIAEQLRKRQLLQDMATQQQQPSSTPIPQSMKPPGQYDPAQGMQDAAKLISQYKPADMTDYTKAAKEYGAPLEIPRAGAIDPNTNKPMYPRNKLLTALVAPLMFKQILRNPKAGIEGLNVLTRKGYEAAEEKYTQDTENRQRNFKVQSDLLNQTNKTLLDNLAGAKDSMEANKYLAEYQQKIKEWPLDLQKKVQDLAIGQQTLEKAKTPIVQDKPVTVITKDGEVTAQMRHNQDGTFDFIRPGEKDPIQGVLDYHDQITPHQLTNDEQVYKALSEDWFRNNPDWVKEHGKNLPGPIAAQFNTKVAESRYEYQAQQKLAQIALQKSNREAEIAKAGIQHDYLQTKNRDANQLISDRKPLITQIEALRGTQAAASISDKNGVAANIAIIDQIMSGASKMSSRYNTKEFDRILGGAGKWEEFKSKVQAWTRGGPGVSKEVLKQVQELVGITQNELKRQFDINNKYARMLEGAKNEEQVSDVMNKYANELGDFDNWNKGIEQSPEDRLKALQAEKDRRQKGK